MARAKKTNKFSDVITPLSVDDLKSLISEAKYALAEIERAESKEAKMGAAIKKRDSLKIGDTVSFTIRGAEVSGTVVTISVDKVQLEQDGKKKSYSILKLV